MSREQGPWWRSARHSGAGLDAVVAHEVNSREYLREYGLVSGGCFQLQLVAEPICGSCSQFQLVVTRRNHSARTFNPKVTGSIPVRPIVVVACCGAPAARQPTTGCRPP